MFFLHDLNWLSQGCERRDVLCVTQPLRSWKKNISFLKLPKEDVLPGVHAQFQLVKQVQ